MNLRLEQEAFVLEAYQRLNRAFAHSFHPNLNYSVDSVSISALNLIISRSRKCKFFCTITPYLMQLSNFPSCMVNFVFVYPCGGNWQFASSIIYFPIGFLMRLTLPWCRFDVSCNVKVYALQCVYAFDHQDGQYIFKAEKIASEF